MRAGVLQGCSNQVKNVRRRSRRFGELVWQGSSTESVLPKSSPEGRHGGEDSRSAVAEPEIKLRGRFRGDESYQMSRGNTCSLQEFEVQVSSATNLLSP